MSRNNSRSFISDAAVLVILSTATLVAEVAAQQIDGSWLTIDGGGGTSVGNGYELRGTIGQADTSVLAGSNLTLAGGFWPGSESASLPCPEDINGDGTINAIDLSQILGSFGAMGQD